MGRCVEVDEAHLEVGDVVEVDGGGVSGNEVLVFDATASSLGNV